MQGGAHRRQYTQKAEHTKGGLWPPQESCYLRGHRQGGAHTRRNTQKAVCGHRRSHFFKGATSKAVHTEGGAHKRRSVATAGVLLLIYRGGVVSIWGYYYKGGGGDGLNRTFGRPTRPDGGTAGLSAGRRYSRTSGHFFGQNKGGVTD